MVLAELHLEKNQHIAQVLVCFLVQYGFNLWVSVVLHLIEVLFEDKVAPYLNNFTEKGFSLYKTAFFFEKLAHVVVATAHVVTFGAVLVTLQVNAFS